MFLSMGEGGAGTASICRSDDLDGPGLPANMPAAETADP